MAAADDQTAATTWKPFQFMMGEWIGGGSGKPGDATGEFSLAFDLDKNILVRKNHAKNPATGASHDDLMVIYPQGGKDSFRAEYFDNEGHVIHYSTSFAPNKVIFESDAAANAPRFRLTYELKPGGVLSIEFAMAAPGKALQPYVTGTAKRK